MTLILFVLWLALAVAIGLLWRRVSALEAKAALTQPRTHIGHGAGLLHRRLKARGLR